MIIFAIDPSLGCTGYAMLHESKGSVYIVGAGRSKIGGGPLLGLRTHFLAAEIYAEFLALLKELGNARSQQIHVVIESPQTFSAGMKGKRSAATLPNYGACFGAIYSYFALHTKLEAPLRPTAVHEVSASKWAIGSKVKGDKYKTVRVAAVVNRYKLEEGQLGPVSEAGNVADAVLMAEWWINNGKLEAAKG